MIAAIRPLASLLVGVAFLLAGSGLLGTLLAVRGRLEGFDERAIGLMMSAYYVGFFVGTLFAPPLIKRIGHIRAFAFYASLCAATVLLHPILIDPWVWGVLRALTGVSLVGLYTVIESWLNAQATPAQRGQVFATYMAVNLLALASGQWLLVLAPTQSFLLFSLVAILICLAALPVTASRMSQPQIPDRVQLALSDLFRKVPAAAGGALLSGMASSAFWGLGAVYATRMGLDVFGISVLMSVTIIGGALLQWPIGRLSDRGDRRTTLTAISVLAAMVAIAVPYAAAADPRLLYVMFFAYGGLVFAVYPVCVAHLLDHVDADDVLSASSSLLLCNGLGAIAGPALAGIAMNRFGANALPGFFAGTFILLALVAGGRRLLRRRDRTSPSQFHPMTRTTPTALELLPETDVDASPTTSSSR